MGNIVFRGLKGVPYTPYDGERIRCTARDFQALAMAGRMYIACAGKVGDMVIKPRIRHIPGAWRNYKSGLALMGRAMNAALQTVPDDQFNRISTLFDYAEITLDLPKASVNGRGGSVLAVDSAQLMALVYYAMRNECAICLKEGGEAKRCELYAALKGCYEPETWDTYGCPWRDTIIETLRMEREEKEQQAKKRDGKKRR